MKIIYTILFAACALFCQAFGAQDKALEPVDTICVNGKFNAESYNESILALIQGQEQNIWRAFYKKVERYGDLYVEFKGDTEQKGKTQAKSFTIDQNGTVYITMKYKRCLVCSNIPGTEPDSQTPEFAMWFYFGKLLSETDGDDKNPVVVSDTATIESMHEATFAYRLELNFPGEGLKIEGEECISEGQDIHLSVPSAYKPYDLQWTVNGEETTHMGTDVTIKSDQDKYLNTIVCTARACKGQTRSASFEVGKPVSKPEMSDFGCLAADKTVLDLSVKAPEPQLTYHWMYENVDGKVVWEKKGSSVRLEGIPQNETGRIKLMATGGCKNSDTAQQTLYRTFRTDTRYITLQGGRNCAFIGDTLSFSMEDPLPSFVWRVNDTMPGNKPLQVFAPNTDPIFISVFVPGCPDRKITDTFNIRDTFKVSLASNPTCISVKDEHVIKFTSNGLNPEVHWYGNGIEIDTTTYSKKDSILVRLTNPGDPNLFVAVTGKKCGRESDTLLVLRPLPEKPSLDASWNTLTPCIPLGMMDTIELRVQPQEGVNFTWDCSQNSKFQQITMVDSSSILIETNFGLSDSEEDKTIPISVYASTYGCPNSDTLQETLYATGAGLDSDWKFGYQDIRSTRRVGFKKNDGKIETDFHEDLKPYEYEWYINGLFEENQNLYWPLDLNSDFPVAIKCILRDITNNNWKNSKGCPSVYEIMFLERTIQQNISSESDGETNKIGEQVLLRLEYSSQPFKDEKKYGLTLHPNPARSGVWVKVEGICETESFTVECYSPQGRLMFREKATGETFTFPTDNYAAGVYIVKIQPTGESSPIVKKLIIL